MKLHVGFHSVSRLMTLNELEWLFDLTRDIAQFPCDSTVFLFLYNHQKYPQKPRNLEMITLLIY